MEWYVFKTELIENLKIVKHIYLLFIKATVNNFFLIYYFSLQSNSWSGIMGFQDNKEFIIP